LFYHEPALAATTFCAAGRRGIRLLFSIASEGFARAVAEAAKLSAAAPNIPEMEQIFSDDALGRINLMKASEFISIGRNAGARGKLFDQFSEHVSRLMSELSQKLQEAPQIKGSLSTN
jgi:hypothetical protein